MDEIKRLQEEFQQAQMSGSVGKISEKNCIDIIMKLQALEMIELIYTQDAKQYLTLEQLEKEIKEEVYVNGGRITVTAVQEATNVDICHVEKAIDTLVKHEADLHLIQSELLDSSYIDTIAVEINDLLIESGNVSLGELCKRFTLPSDFLLQQLQPRIGTIIQGKLDEADRNSIFTDAFVDRQTASILGVFSAITRPTSISAMVGRYGFHERLFLTVINGLVDSGQLPGTVSGRGSKQQYVPNLQQRTQERWINSFYTENQYIEFDAVSRLGIRNPKADLKKRFSKGLSLETCHVNQTVVDNVAGSVDEALATCEILDVMVLLPAPCTDQDAYTLLNTIPALKRSNTTRILCDSFVCGDDFISKCADLFKEPMEKKAQEVSVASKKQAATSKAAPAPAKPSLEQADDDSEVSKMDKRAARKAKKAKKKGAAADDDDDGGGGGGGGRGPDVNQQWSFMSLGEVQELLEKNFRDIDAKVFEELAGILHRQLTKRFQEYVREAFQKGSDTAGIKADRSQNEAEYRELYIKARLFQQGAEEFEGQPLEALTKYLLKSFGASMLNMLCQIRAAEDFVDADFPANMTQEQRAKVLKRFPAGAQAELTTLNTLLSEKTIDAFMNPLEDAGNDAGFVVKRSDKKRDRQVLLGHKHTMTEQLQNESSAPTILHLACLLLFQQHTGHMLHAAGRNVPQIVTLLKEHVAPEVHTQLDEYQKAVMQSLVKNEDSLGPTAEQTAALKAAVKSK